MQVVQRVLPKKEGVGTARDPKLRAKTSMRRVRTSAFLPRLNVGRAENRNRKIISSALLPRLQDCKMKVCKGEGYYLHETLIIEWEIRACTLSLQKN